MKIKVGNVYKNRAGLNVFVYYKSPVRSCFDCVVAGENALFYSVEENGQYNHYSDNVSPNGFIILIKVSTLGLTTHASILATDDCGRPQMSASSL